MKSFLFVLAAAVSAEQTRYIVKLNADQLSNGFTMDFDLEWVNEILARNSDPVSKRSDENHIFQQFNFGEVQAFAVQTTAEILEQIKSDSRVEYAIRDKDMILYQWPFGGSAWGLDRADQRELPLNQKYENFPSSQGEGVTVYVIDTGINDKHADFEGRASQGPSFVKGIQGTDSFDRQGHGTHCAGTIASKSYGIAKKAKVVGISIFGSSSSATTSSVLAAIQWVYQNAASGKSVVSMSLGDDLSSCTVAEPCNDPITKKAIASLARERNIPVVVAAGNDNTDACRGAPASEPWAYTVGSTTTSDNRSSFSNWGSCLDIFAPGSNIKSTWVGSTSSTSTISGTSMACPHVSGAFALLLSDNKFSNVQDAYDAMSAKATKNAVKDAKDSVNRLLYVGAK